MKSNHGQATIRIRLCQAQHGSSSGTIHIREQHLLYSILNGGMDYPVTVLVEGRQEQMGMCIDESHRRFQYKLITNTGAWQNLSDQYEKSRLRRYLKRLFWIGIGKFNTQYLYCSLGQHGVGHLYKSPDIGSLYIIHKVALIPISYTCFMDVCHDQL